MTDLDALYRAILAHPDEDTPRLMYADALDERDRGGDSHRAAFVRAQVEGRHADADAIFRDVYTTTLYASAFPELAPNRWLFGTIDGDRPLRLSVGITSLVRGFVGHLAVTAQQWVHIHERVAAEFPIEGLSVTRWSGYEQQLSAAVTPGLRVLQLTGSDREIRDADVVALVSHSRHKGWADTLREVQVHRPRPAALERLRTELPRVRIRTEAGVWLPADAHGHRAHTTDPTRAGAA